MQDEEGTREVLVHLNVAVPASMSHEEAKDHAVFLAIDAAHSSRERFEELVALVDPT